MSISNEESLRVIDPTTDPRWQRFIDRRVDALIFHHPGWLTLLRAQYRFETLAVCLEREGEIVAGIPFCRINVLTPRRKLVCLPFSDHCGPLVRSSADERTLLHYVRDGLGRQTHHVEIRSGLESQPEFETHTAHWVHILELDRSLDDLSRDLLPDVRRRIKKGRDNGLVNEIRDDEGAMDIFYRLHLLTRRKQGVPIQPRRYFRLLQRHVIERKLGFVSLTRKDDRYLSAAVFCGFKSVLVYKYSASDPEHLGLSPNQLMFWKAIVHAKQQGFSRLDFGKTDFSNEGLRRFKTGWNPKESELSYSYFPRTPLTGNINWLGTTIVKPIIRHSPLLVCRLAGELLYRRFAA